jgi:hypothetical protein
MKRMQEMVAGGVKELDRLREALNPPVFQEIKHRQEVLKEQDHFWEIKHALEALNEQSRLREALNPPVLQGIERISAHFRQESYVGT